MTDEYAKMSAVMLVHGEKLPSEEKPLSKFHFGQSKPSRGDRSKFWPKEKERGFYVGGAVTGRWSSADVLREFMNCRCIIEPRTRFKLTPSQQVHDEIQVYVEKDVEFEKKFAVEKHLEEVEYATFKQVFIENDWGKTKTSKSADEIRRDVQRLMGRRADRVLIDDPQPMRVQSIDYGADGTVSVGMVGSTVKMMAGEDLEPGDAVVIGEDGKVKKAVS